jgi:hypothetical protein
MSKRLFLEHPRRLKPDQIGLLAAFMPVLALLRVSPFLIVGELAMLGLFWHALRKGDADGLYRNFCLLWLLDGFLGALLAQHEGGAPLIPWLRPL